MKRGTFSRLLNNVGGIIRTPIRQFAANGGRCNGGDIVICSAVRTPVTESLRGLMSSDECAALAVKTAVQHAAVNFEGIHRVYFSNPYIEHTISEALYGGMPPGVCVHIKNIACKSGMDAMVRAASALRLKQANIVIAGEIYGKFEFVNITEPLEDTIDIWSINRKHLNNYANKSYARSKKAWEIGAFDAETVPLVLPENPSSHKETYITVDEDSLEKRDGVYRSHVSKNMPPTDGACAMLLMTSTWAKRLGLTPLARIISYESFSLPQAEFPTAPAMCTIRMLMDNQTPKTEVTMYELNDPLSIIPCVFMTQMKLTDEHINVHGGIFSLNDNSSMSACRMVAHLAHSLLPGQLGVAVLNDCDGNAWAMIVEGLPTTWSSRLPCVTVFTKPNCALTGEMMSDLEEQFSKDCTIQKVDLTSGSDLHRFLRLYRFDTPVAFLNGQFLCWHELNMRLLRLKLQRIQAACKIAKSFSRAN